MFKRIIELTYVLWTILLHPQSRNLRRPRRQSRGYLARCLQYRRVERGNLPFDSRDEIEVAESTACFDVNFARILYLLVSTLLLPGVASE